MALRKITLSVAAVAALSSASFAADSLESAFTQGKADGQVRGMYLQQVNTTYGSNTPNNNSSGFAVGGNLGFTTAPYYGISAGAKFYTSQVLANSANFNQSTVAPYFENAASTSAKTPQSYSVLGQAYVQGAYGKTIVKVGRQQLDTPLAGSDDNYMIPNLFQAAVLINQDLPGTTLVAAYVNGMMGGTTGDSHAGTSNAQTGFTSMSTAALSTGIANSSLSTGNIGNQPVYALAAVNSSLPDTTIQAWYYNNTNVLQAFYASADVAVPVAGFKPYGAVQYYNLSNQGATKTLLNSVNLKLNYAVTGVKVGTDTPLGLTPEVAGNFVSGSQNSVAVFNAWGGTPNYTDMAFVNISNFAAYAGTGGANAMGTNVWKFSATQDLGKFGLGDRNIQLAYGMYDFAKTNNNGNNTDVAVYDVVYSCKNALVKNLELKAFYEGVKYNNAWQNAGFTTKSSNYIFARAIYGF